MILVLCHDTDSPARWAAGALALRGHAVQVVTDRDLADAESWNHRVTAAGADGEIVLAGGTVLRLGLARGVLNRLAYLPAAWLLRWGGPDRAYAIQEMHAFYLSWLFALPGPVLNPPTPQGLCGNWRHRSAWTALAARAGLPVAPFRQASDDVPAAPRPLDPAPAHVVVAGARVVGADWLTAAHRDACMRLSRAAGTPLLGIELAHHAGRWQMTGASVLPDLVAGGAPLIDALEEALVS